MLNLCNDSFEYPLVDDDVGSLKILCISLNADCDPLRVGRRAKDFQPHSERERERECWRLLLLLSLLLLLHCSAVAASVVRWSSLGRLTEKCRHTVNLCATLAEMLKKTCLKLRES